MASDSFVVANSFYGASKGVLYGLTRGVIRMQFGSQGSAHGSISWLIRRVDMIWECGMRSSGVRFGVVAR